MGASVDWGRLSSGQVCNNETIPPMALTDGPPMCNDSWHSSRNLRLSEVIFAPKASAVCTERAGDLSYGAIFYMMTAS